MVGVEPTPDTLTGCGTTVMLHAIITNSFCDRGIEPLISRAQGVRDTASPIADKYGNNRASQRGIKAASPQ